MWLRARYMERNLPCCQHSPVLCRRLVSQKCHFFKASLARREPAGESPYYCHITCFVSTARGAASKHSSFAPQTRMNTDRWAGLHSKDASNVPRKCCAMPSWELGRVQYGTVWSCSYQEWAFQKHTASPWFCSGKGIGRLIHSTVPRAKVPKETDERHAKRVALSIRPGIKIGPFKAAQKIQHNRRNLWNKIDYTRLRRPFSWWEMLGDPWNVILCGDNLHAQKASLLSPDPGLWKSQCAETSVQYFETCEPTRNRYGQFRSWALCSRQ